MVPSSISYESKHFTFEPQFYCQVRMSLITKVIFFSLHFCAAQSYGGEIQELLSEFDIKHSNIIRSSSINKDKTLLKELSYLDNYSKALWSNDINMENKNIVLINTNKIRQQDIQWFLNHNQFYKMLIIDINGSKSYEELSMNIGQEVYFYDETTTEVLEAYEINDVKVRSILGHYHVKNNSFTWNPSKNQNIFRRRANFYGMKLKGMLEHATPSIFINNKYKEYARFFKSNETYLMNGFVKGINIDVLEHLQDCLNFTMLLYKRKVESFGYVKDWENGTLTGTGMMGDIFFKKADMIISGFMITESRSIYVDYLRPILAVKFGLYISKEAIYDGMEYDNYFKAFQLYTWIVILLSIISISMIKLLVFIIIRDNKEKDSFIFVGLKLVWSAMKSIFGGKVSNPDIDSGITQSIILFVWSLCGSVIWIHYRSQITALLSISNPNKPFHDLESMANTNWR